MAGGVPAGRLSIEIVAEVARLQADMDRIKRVVKSGSNEIAASAKHANDNLAAIGKGGGAGLRQFSQEVQRATEHMLQLARGSSDVATRVNALTGATGGIRRSADDIATYGSQLDSLRAKYSPIFAAVQQYRQSLDDIRRAHAVGAISADEMGAAISRERQQALGSIGALKGRAAAITEAAAAARAASQAEAQAAAQTAAYASQAGALRAQLDPMFSAQQRFNQAMDQADDLMRVGAITAREYAAAQTLARTNLQQHAQAVAGMTKAASPLPIVLKETNDGLVRTATGSKLAAHQATNLAYQFQDLGVQWAAAAQSGKPLQMVMMSLVQQGPQIGMIMREAGIGAKGLAAEIGGMVSRFVTAHPVLTTFALIAGTAAGAANLLASSLSADRKADLDAYTKSLGLSNEELKKMGPLTITVTDLINGLGETMRQEFSIKAPKALDGMKASFMATFNGIMQYNKVVIAAFYAGWVGGYEGIKATWKMLPAVMADAIGSAVNLALAGLEKFINLNIAGINKVISMVNSAMGAFSTQKLGEISPVTLGRITTGYEGAGLKAGAAFGNAVSGAFNDAMAKQSSLYNRWMDNSAQEAKNRFRETAKEKGFMDPEKAKKDGKKAGKEFVDEFMKAVLAMQRDLNGKLLTLADPMIRNTREWIKQQADLVDIAMKAVNDDADAKSRLETRKKEIELTERLVASAQNLASAFDQLGSGTLGNIAAMLAGLTSGDFSGVRGAFGGLLQTLNQSDAGKSLVKDLTDALDDVFGDSGSFTSTMNGVLQHAGLGLAAGSLILGKNGSKIGSSIGGAIGGAAATAFLGAAAGPLGALAGGILGGVVGNLLKSNRTAGAVLTGPNSMVIGGKDKDNYGAASDLGSAVLESLNKIADAFGATLGSFQTAIGVRGDQIRVNANGTSLKFDQGAVGFGQDSAAALKFAIKDAISDGAFEGLSDGVKRLLNGEGDIEKQIQKALSFQGVFDELEQLKDPQAYQLKQLDEWRKGMDAIFAEAGATADELAKLEELTGLKRKEIVEKYGQDIANAEEIAKQKRQLEITIMELEGKSVEALAAMREIERSEADASLRPLYDRIYALQDEQKAAAEAAAAAEEAARIAKEAAEARLQAEREAAAKAASIAKTRRDMEIRIMELEGNTAGALAARRADELAALDPSLVALQQRIYALEDEKNAVEAGTAAIADAARQMLLAGDSAGYVAEMTRRAMAGATGDPRVDNAVRALNQISGDPERYQIQLQRLESIINQNARRELSINALLVENVGEALDAVRNLAARPNTDLGWSIVQGIRDGFAELAGGQTLDRSFATVMGRQRGNRLFGDADAPGIAGVRSASDQLDFVSARGYSNQRFNEIVDSLGAAADGLLEKTEGTFRMLGRDVESMTDMLARLSGQMFEGSVTTDQARAQIEALVEMFPQLTTVAQSMEAQIERATMAAETLTRTGLRSIDFYFGNLSDMAAQLASNGSAASETLDTLSGAIGRMNSFATVFEESVAAVERGSGMLSRLGSDQTLNPRDLRDMAAAEAIAAAAREAAGFLITEQGKAISDALSDDAAFAGVSPELRKTAALLLQGIGAYDIPSFEAAFIRMSDALANGTITVDQFNALFAYSKDIVTDAASAAEEAARVAAEALEKAKDIARQAREMDIRIAELTLGSAAAELMRREDILKALDPSLHARQKYIWQLEDEAKAASAAADAAAKFADMARSVISELDSIIDVLNGGLDNLVGQSETMRQMQDAQAMAYLRGIRGVPDLNDTFRNAVSTASSLSSDGFTSQIDYLREFGQRTILFGELREDAEQARWEAEQQLEEAQRKAQELALIEQQRQNEFQEAQLDQAKSTNEKIDKLQLAYDQTIALLQSIAESTANTSNVQDRLLSDAQGEDA